MFEYLSISEMYYSEFGEDKCYNQIFHLSEEPLYSMKYVTKASPRVTSASFVENSFK